MGHLIFGMSLLVIGLPISTFGGFIAKEGWEKRHRAEITQTRESGILLSPTQKTYPKLKIGNSNIFFNYNGPVGKPLIRTFEDTGLTIWVDKGKMKLSTKIRDKNGDIIAEILSNEWKIKPDKRWDRNYNEKALEVKDAKGDIVLQVVMEKDYIQFAAKMYSRKGDGFAIGSTVFTEEDIAKHEQGALKIVASANGPKEVKVGDTTATLEIRPNPPGLPLELTIEPIFSYPSDFHLGELLSSAKEE